jgi:DNA polymerase-3 subunit alpha
MTQDKFGQLIFSESDIVDLVMQGRDVSTLKNILVDATVDVEKAALLLDCVPDFVTYNASINNDLTVEQFDRSQQRTWHMPQEYQQLDIAQYILDQCKTDAELQRCGQELLMYQERDLFDLLRFLKYLVDTMTEHQVIWGVGRGSSVASYVLYKLGVHRINSMFYDLDVGEFLR